MRGCLPQDTVTSVLYLPSRGVLATGSLDMHVKLWDVSSAKGRCLSSIVPEDLFDQDPVKGLASDPEVRPTRGSRPRLQGCMHGMRHALQGAATCT